MYYSKELEERQLRQDLKEEIQITHYWHMNWKIDLLRGEEPWGNVVYLECRRI